MDHHQQEELHTVGYGPYIMIWLALVVFTGITVSAAGIGFGRATVPIALGIATIKTFLVGAYFMHLKFENKVIKAMVIICMITFVIFLGLTLFDIVPRYEG